MGSPLHSPGSWYAHDFVCALQEWSLCSSDSLGLPKLFPGWPGWDVWRGAQNLYNSGTTSLITAVLLLWVAHLAIWDIILLWLCPSFCLIAASPLSLDVGFFFFFLMGSSVLLSMFVEQLVVILVLSKEEVNAGSSTLPSWTNILFSI